MSKRVNNRKGKRGRTRYNKQWIAQRAAERYNGRRQT